MLASRKSSVVVAVRPMWSFRIAPRQEKDRRTKAERRHEESIHKKVALMDHRKADNLKSAPEKPALPVHRDALPPHVYPHFPRLTAESRREFLEILRGAKAELAGLAAEGRLAR
jgi:hypothetical protein